MRICVSLLFLFAGLVGSLSADDSAKEQFFETKIRPVLVSHCYECHSASAKEPKGGLLLDTREGIRRGGESGHGVVPGLVEESLLIGAMKHESFEMPPDEQLPDQVVADFEKWVRDGAFDPRDGKSAMIRREIDFDRAREFWSFQPVVNPPTPTVKNTSWPKSQVDAFILSRLEAKGLQPGSDASSDVLARRIYFDLIGLPPTPSQLSEFADAMEQDPDVAIETLVDKLLKSPLFGERWGRHWLDVVRFAESTGMERNATFTRAWHYRNYVIDAFNHDTPFDQFIREQVAGDLLPFDSIQQRDRQLIATGMLAIGPKSLNETKKDKFQMDVVDEQIDVVTRAFIGLTASCARCHDHKFDPIPQSEYYALAGIFTSTETLYGTTKTNGNRNPGRLLSIDGDRVAATAVAGSDTEAKKYRNQIKSNERKLAAFRKQLKVAKSEVAKDKARKRISDAEDTVRRLRARLKQATQPKVTVGKNSRMVMAVAESQKIGDTRLRIRGEPDEMGREVPRGFLTIASLEENPHLADDQSGRLELAEWITRPSNPLTARVLANRVWQHLMGRGIVRTVNNFGANGDRPSHPKLLDHLATSLIENGWAVKPLIRQVMLSRVYRLSSRDDSESLAADPNNDLYWRMNQRRLEAEAIRDAMLSASGQLELSRPTVSAVQQLGEGIIGRNINTASLSDGQHVRSVYLPIVRGAVPEMLRLFDFPEPSIVGGVRNVTTVPTQALFMMNSPRIIEQANKLAHRLAERVDEPRRRVEQAYLLTLSRHPSGEEVELALQFVRDSTSLLQGEKKTSADAEAIAWAGFCQSLFASSEFRYIN